jgi:hypothetical protein
MIVYNTLDEQGSNDVGMTGKTWILDIMPGGSDDMILDCLPDNQE